MTKEQFDTLAVGDKVCNLHMVAMWGYVEDINRDKGEVEFDVEESLNSAGITIPKNTEIKSNFAYLMLLEKAPPVANGLSLEAKETIAHIYRLVTDMQNAMMDLKNKLKI